MAIEHPLKISKHDSFNLMATSTNGESSRGYSRYLQRMGTCVHVFPMAMGCFQGFPGAAVSIATVSVKNSPQNLMLAATRIVPRYEKKRASTLQSQWDPIWEDKKPDCHFWWGSTYSKSSSTKLNPSTDFRRVQLILSDQLHVTCSA